MLITDPPYGMAYLSGWVRARKDRPIHGDNDTTARDTIIKAWGNKPALVFGKWNVDRPKNTIHRLIWSKHPDPGMGDLTMPWGSSEEEVYVLGKGFIGKRRSNVISCPKPPIATRPDHPTPKPIPLMEELIAKCPPEWVIIDPFVGSGATLRAAKNLGRRAVGFEIEEKYCRIAADSLAQEVLPL